jgi:uncharacterized protein YgiM (DUF1202 family)
VAAIAEVQLLFDKMGTDAPEALDSTTVAEVTERIRISDELTRKHKYAAAVYYANRAMRILNLSERRQNLPAYDGETRIVTVTRANLREGPGPDFKVIDQLAFGAVLIHLESHDEWSKIRTRAGVSGWIHKSLIK